MLYSLIFRVASWTAASVFSPTTQARNPGPDVEKEKQAENDREKKWPSHP